MVGLFGVIIAWRTAAGALSLKEVGETSAILAWPVWIPQMLMVPEFSYCWQSPDFTCADTSSVRPYWGCLNERHTSRFL